MYLPVVHAIPVERTCQVIADLTGAKVSPGFVHGILARAAALLEAFKTLTKMLIILAYVVHSGETTLRAGGKGTKQYVWTASTTLYTSHYLGDSSRTRWLRMAAACRLPRRPGDGQAEPGARAGDAGFLARQP